ncbi:TPA: hypothetical protein PXN07_003943 [Yersinia enterocolitica]|nr:hypothetical protein [Yersinia enterocolitica]
MKINNNMRFPYPVLGPLTKDYNVSTFEFRDIEVEENRENWEVTINGDLLIEQSKIKKLISGNEVFCYVYVTCGNTYYSLFKKINCGRFSFTLPPGSIRGKVEIRPIIFTKKDNIKLGAGIVNEEFGVNVNLPAFKPIAIGYAITFEAGYEKLVPMESIFKLIKTSDIDAGTFLVKLDGQSIDILASPEIHEIVSKLRVNDKTRNILLSSLYLPCYMEVFKALADNIPESYRWVRIMKAKCEAYGIDYTNAEDHLKNAQKLLSNPLSLLEISIKELSNG